MASRICRHVLLLTMLPLSVLCSFLSLLTVNEVSASPQYCKPIPGSPKWPSTADWQSLNKTIHGHLLSASPPGAVCHPSSASYNNVTCAALLQDWTSSAWHAQDPITADYNDDTCLPDARAPCSTSGYPAYVVNATSAADVQAGVSFAKKTGVRLIVKGTGHDFPGRSSGPYSLSIWTHNIRGITIQQNDARAVRAGGAASVKVAAGMRMGEVYEAMLKNGLTFVGGADPNVGVGGWFTGGGHSPISSFYGLGADQVLEMELVTADGQYRMVNATSYPDLFWAMRGGGGSTFGVMLSVTVKAYPPLPTVMYLFAYNTTSASDTFWSMTAYFHSQMPQISNAGAMGYFYVFQNVTSEPDPAKRGKIYGAWLIPNKTTEEAQAIFAPMETHIQNANWSDPVGVSSGVLARAAFTELWVNNPAESVGNDGRLGSWLLGEEALSQDLTLLKEQLRKTSPDPWPLIGHVTAGPGVHNAIPAGGSAAVLPAWRKAYIHEVIPREWPQLNATAKQFYTSDLRDVRTPALKALQPDSGAYINEADPTNPDWQHDYFGENYPRLLSIKKTWDPEGVFWCKPCVGHELWQVQGTDGVGQDGTKLCKVQ